MRKLFYLLFLLPFLGIAQDWEQLQKIVASDRGAGDNFGWSVAMSGDYAIVGAPQGQATQYNSGSAYIFKREGNSWIQQQKIVAADRAVNDYFGWSVAIDGDYVVVGARGDGQDVNGGNTINNAGSVYIFKREGDNWIQQQKIVAADRDTDAYFGRSVSIDGNYIVVGADRERYDANGENPTLNAGAAYIFKREGDNWSQQQKIVAPQRYVADMFGRSISVSGDLVVIGSHGHGYDENGGGHIGGAGAAYVYRLENGVWGMRKKLVASNRRFSGSFGGAVAIDGNIIVVGAPYHHDSAHNSSGRAYVFELDGNTWLERAILHSAVSHYDNVFGNSVAVRGNNVVVGAPGESEDPYGEYDGAAYIFSGELWNQRQKIVSSDLSDYDAFGENGIAISDNYIIVGARLEDHDVNGGNPLFNPGSAYIFSKPSVVVESVTVSVADGADTILCADIESIQLVAMVLPVNASNPAVAWSIVSGSEYASVNENGLVTILGAGTAIIRATSVEFPDIFGEITITVNALPVLAIETTEFTICSGTAAELYVTSEGNVINWYNSPDAETPIFTGSPFITPELTTLMTYWAEAVSEEGCISERVEVRVTVEECEPSEPPCLEWEKTYGGSFNDNAANIKPTLDGGYIFTVQTWSNDGDVSGHHGGVDVWVVKTDVSGTIEWQRAFGGSLDDSAGDGSVVVNEDGTYLILARSNSTDGDLGSGYGHLDWWLFKLSPAGEILWQQRYGGSNTDSTTDARSTIDGGYIFTGYTSSSDGHIPHNQGGEDAWIMKVNSQGEIEWQRTYGGSGNDQAIAVAPDPDGGYIIAGFTTSSDGDVNRPNRGGTDGWVFKLDAWGNILWQRTLGGNLEDKFQDIETTPDGGYLAIGHTYSTNGDITSNHGAQDAWAVKLNAEGGIEWSKTYGGSLFDIFHNVLVSEDGGYIMAGYTNSSNGDVPGTNGSYDMWVSKLNSIGFMEWSKTMGGTAADVGIELTFTQDNGLVIGGYTASSNGDVSLNRGGNDAWVVKLTYNIPEISIENPDSICEGTSVILIAGTNGTAVRWYDAEDATEPVFTGNPFETPVLTETTTYWLEAANAECTSQRISVTLEVIPIPELQIESPVETCEEGSVELTVETEEGNTVRWYDAIDAVDPVFTGNPYNTPVLTETTSFWVEAADEETGCISGRIEIEVMVHPLPELSIETPNPEICIGDTIVLAVETNGEIVYWYDSSDGNEPVSTDNPYEIEDLTETTTFWVEAVNAATGCLSERLEITVTVHPLPELTIENPNPEICIEDTVILAVETNGNMAYWYDSADGTEPVSTDNPYEIEGLTETTTFWVETEDSETGCTSERIEIIVTVHPLPELTIENPNPEICIGDAILLAVETNGNMVYWYNSADGTEPVSTDNPYEIEGLTETTTFWVETEDSETGCTSERMEITVTVHPLPEIAIENPNPEFCIGESIILSVETNGNMVYWYNSADGTEPVFTDNPYEIEGLTETTTFWVETEDSETGCLSERLEITVTVHPLPALTIENEEPEICIGEMVELTAFSAGNIIRWYDEQNVETPVYIGETYTVSGLTETTIFWVETEDSETGCISERQEIPVIVNPQPEIALENPAAEVCWGEILEITVTTNGETVNWYDAEDAVTPVFTGNPYVNDNFTGSAALWVEAVSGANCVSERQEIPVTVHPLPELIIEDESPEICAGEEVILQAYSNGNIIYWYYEQNAETPIHTGESYEIPGLTTTTEFWVQAVNPITGCTSIRESIPVIVNPAPEIQETETLYFCDSLNDDEEFVDLTQNNITNNPGINLKYYAGPEELEDDSPIGNPAHFLIDSSPGVVYVLAAAGNGCLAYAELTVILTGAPAVSDTELKICSPNGIGTYQLTDADESIMANPTNYTITYHVSYEEAKDSSNPLPETYENASANQTIFARVEEGENCFNIAEVLLTYNETFVHLSEPLEECDEDNDGFAIFDLTEKEPDISAIFGSSGYIIIYYESPENAYDNVNEIPNPESYVNISNPQTVYAKVLDVDICLGIVSFDLIAIELPEIEVPELITLCPGEEEGVIVQSGFASYTWTNPNGTVVSITNSAVLDTEGTYILEVTFSDTICIFREEIEVTFDNSPVVTNIEVNGNTVIVTAAGTPPLEYSMNGGQTWQDSNVFYDVPYGNYEVIVRNLNGCKSGIYPVVVFELTNIITPNGDGYNDTWEIPALVNYPGASLKLFNRDGKILVDIHLENGFSWDGRYSGNPLPSTSYWYILDLNNGQKMIGNITLKNY